MHLFSLKNDIIHKEGDFMKILLTTLNAKYIHTNLALRWLYVTRNPNDDVMIYEFTVKDNLEVCAQKIAQESPDVIGISVYIWNSEETKEWILKIKKLLPNVRIILGGPEVSFDANSWLDLPIECVLRGEGEKGFWEICHQRKIVDGYLSKERQSDVQYAKVDLSWLEQFESPYFLEMDQEISKNRYCYIETSRGCPYHCSYCLSSCDNDVRFFSENYVLETLQRLSKKSCKQVKFLDRTFNVNPNRALKIAKSIANLDVEYSFQVEVVADCISEELLSFFEEGNQERFRFEVGVQSFNKESLRAVCRDQDLEKLKEVVMKLNRVGHHLHVDLIAGLPYEDLSSFKNSYVELFSCFSDEIQVGILKLLKGTALRRQAIKFGIEFNLEAPYEIKKTNWLSEKDIKEIEWLYQATEKLYNSGRCRNILKTLFDKDVDVFEILKETGRKMQQFSSQIQTRDMFLFLIESLQDVDCPLTEEERRALFSSDYYRLFKQKPKRLFDQDVDHSLRKEVYEQLIEQKIFNEQDLYRYGKLEWGYFNNKILLQLFLYSKMQQLPQEFWIEKDGETYGIMDCNAKQAQN